MFQWQCSSERNNPFAKFYHNTTSHYNAYYIAREKLDEAEYQIQQGRDDNFNEILPVYDPMTEALSGKLSGLSDEAIEKASLPIQYHKNSNWVDDCYILIGRARFYKQDFPNAIQTFKYVNTKSEDEDAKHLALTWLLRTYTEIGEFNNARAVSDFLALQGISKRNVSPVTLARAHFFMQIEDYDAALENLELATKYTRPKKRRARVHFIAAQVAQFLSYNQTSAKHYKATLKSNPSYDLEFYSKLYLAQVTELGNDSDRKTIKKFFEKLLKDRKNTDYRDKIYYELAKFELKQGNVDYAIGYLNESIKATTSNKNQKAYSYLLLAQIYYEETQQYELSKAYYDSTLQNLSDKHKEYASIKKRHEVLIDFVDQINTIQLEDSLQSLAKMDSTEMIAIIDKIIDDEEERKRKEQEAREKQSSFVDPFDEGGFSQSENKGTWYFYNLSAMSIGRTEFTRQWGGRKNEDNWRRANKGISNITPESLAAENPDSEDEEYDPDMYASKEEFQRDKRRKQLIAPIPFSDTAMMVSNEKLQIAFYKLGKIYHFKLEEPENASNTFVELLERFPENENKLEVMYLLYLINKDLNTELSEKYKNILLNNYPNSVYAKLILNPNYVEDAEQADLAAQDLYTSAYKAYYNRSFEIAKLKLQQLIAQYPESSYVEKAELLLVMIVGKGGNWVLYKESIEAFIQSHQESELLPFAKELLKTCNEYIAAATRGSEPVVSESTGDVQESVPYKYDPNDSQMFSLILKGEKLNTGDVMIAFSTFHNKNFKELNLNTSQILLNDDSYIFNVKGFKNMEVAKRYFEKMQGADNPGQKFKDYSPQYFIIGSKNFPLFYRSKNVEAYLSFFRANYFQE